MGQQKNAVRHEIMKDDEMNRNQTAENCMHES